MDLPSARVWLSSTAKEAMHWPPTTRSGGSTGCLEEMARFGGGAWRDNVVEGKQAIPADRCWSNIQCLLLPFNLMKAAGTAGRYNMVQRDRVDETRSTGKHRRRRGRVRACKDIHGCGVPHSIVFLPTKMLMVESVVAFVCDEKMHPCLMYIHTWILLTSDYPVAYSHKGVGGVGGRRGGELRGRSWDNWRTRRGVIWSIQCFFTLREAILSHAYCPQPSFCPEIIGGLSNAIQVVKSSVRPFSSVSQKGCCAASVL